MPAVHGDLAASFIAGDQDAPVTIPPRQVTLRDRVSVATLVPFTSADDVPPSLLRYLSDQLNQEIAKGDTYAMIDQIPLDQFGGYWFSHFGAVMLMGDIKDPRETHAMAQAGSNWTKTCLGSFNIRPNYPGRSNHICNAMFLVTDAARNRGVGKMMGEGYLEWAYQLGYTYAVFNLVYENNVASCRLWDALGFKRIGRVPAAGRLQSNPGEYVDAIIYGRDLDPEGGDSATQDRFDKIRYYLRHSKYPKGADRAEKSRLRSAATHYKLVEATDTEPERLMLKDKEVVSDPQQQYDIARDDHVQQHAGINKTTASIAVKYHWVRIKETVSRVIRDCPHCKETLKVPSGNGGVAQPELEHRSTSQSEPEPSTEEPSIEEPINANQLMHDNPIDSPQSHNPFAPTDPSTVQASVDTMSDYTTMPLDPQIIDIHQHLPRFQHHDAMPTANTHDPDAPHGIPHAYFDDDAARQHAAHDYHMMVDDASDTESLRLVNSQANEVQHEQEILSKYDYVERTEDDLDFT